MVNLVRVAPTMAEDDPQIEAAKQQVAMAMAAMARPSNGAAVPLASGAGAVQAKYGIGNALTDLANKLAEGYALGKARKDYAGLQDKQDAELKAAAQDKLNALAPAIAQGGQVPVQTQLAAVPGDPQQFNPTVDLASALAGRAPMAAPPAQDQVATMTTNAAIPDQINPAHAQLAGALAGMDPRQMNSVLTGLQLRNAIPDPAVVEAQRMREATQANTEATQAAAAAERKSEFNQNTARLTQDHADSVALTKAQMAAKAAEETRGIVVPGVDPITHQSTSNLINPRTGELIKPNIGTPASATSGSARMKIYNDRVFTNAKEAVASMHNIANSPVTADTGILGIGSHSYSLSSTPLQALKNKMTGQDVQTYNSKLMGLGRNLGTVESGGLAVSDTFLQSFEQAKAAPGDTNLTKLHKLAEVRQIVDQAMDVKMSNPDVPDEQKKMIKEMLEDLHKSVPFTHDQVDALEQSGKSSAKMSDFISSKGLSGNSFATEAEAEAAAASGKIKAGDKITVGGKSGTWH